MNGKESLKKWLLVPGCGNGIIVTYKDEWSFCATSMDRYALRTVYRDCCIRKSFDYVAVIDLYSGRLGLSCVHRFCSIVVSIRWVAVDHWATLQDTQGWRWEATRINIWWKNIPSGGPTWIICYATYYVDEMVCDRTGLIGDDSGRFCTHYFVAVDFGKLFQPRLSKFHRCNIYLENWNRQYRCISEHF